MSMLIYQWTRYNVLEDLAFQHPLYSKRYNIFLNISNEDKNHEIIYFSFEQLHNKSKTSGDSKSCRAVDMVSRQSQLQRDILLQVTQ
jgi:hypothetical protein